MLHFRGRHQREEAWPRVARRRTRGTSFSFCSSTLKWSSRDRRTEYCCFSLVSKFYEETDAIHDCDVFVNLQWRLRILVSWSREKSAWAKYWACYCSSKERPRPLLNCAIGVVVGGRKVVSSSLTDVVVSFSSWPCILFRYHRLIVPTSWPLTNYQYGACCCSSKIERPRPRPKIRNLPARPFVDGRFASRDS